MLRIARFYTECESCCSACSKIAVPEYSGGVDVSTNTWFEKEIYLNIKAGVSHIAEHAIDSAHKLPVWIAAASIVFAPVSAVAQQPANKPHEKTLLVVTTTLGFRHAAVDLQEKLIRQLADSSHQFRVVSTSDSPDFPRAEYQATVDERNSHISAAEAQDNDRLPFLGVFGGLPGANPEQEHAVTAMLDAVSPASKREAETRAELSAMIVSGKGSEAELGTMVDKEATASRELAEARSAALAKLQASPQKLSAKQLKIVQQATGGAGGFGMPAPPFAPETQAKVNEVNTALAPLAAKDGGARAALTAASFAGKADEIGADVDALKAADLEYAVAASKQFSSLSGTLSAQDQTQLARTMGVRSAPPFPRRAPQNDPLQERVSKVLQQYLSPEALKNYDAVAFLSTTGELPIPDSDAFFQWIADGHGFVGLHSATDTLHKSPKYIDMIGAEFQTHGMFHPKMEVYNVDPSSPLTAGWGPSRAINEEYYLFKSFDPRKVHLLLELHQQPYTGAKIDVPVSWIKSYGKGRVFYTSLGHRDDVLFDAAIGDQEYKKRYNDASVSKAVDKHILEGVLFALGLVNADMAPQAH